MNGKVYYVVPYFFSLYKLLQAFETNILLKYCICGMFFPDDKKTWTNFPSQWDINSELPNKISLWL